MCDFDWSLVEENSDTWVLDQLGAASLFSKLRAAGEVWPEGKHVGQPALAILWHQQTSHARCNMQAYSGQL